MSAQQRFPFDHNDFILALLGSAKGLRQVTGSYDVLGGLVAEAEAYMFLSQCSLNKALERLCAGIKTNFGQSMHGKFWRVAKEQCRNDGELQRKRPRPPHPFAPCMMKDLAVKGDPSTGGAVYSIAKEAWVFTPRQNVPLYMELAEQRRVMNFQIAEAVYNHQVENSQRRGLVPDFHVMFLALTFAQRATRSTSHAYSTLVGSHIASMAVQYDSDDGRSTPMAFHGLRRWKNLSLDMAMDIGIHCVFGWRTSPRHHQLWHYYRLVDEHKISHSQFGIDSGIFLLLVGVIQDHVFASIPPEDAALAVFTSLFKPHGKCPNSRQRFDISRVLQALQHPRSPYLDVLFPDQCQVATETWAHMLA